MTTPRTETRNGVRHLILCRAAEIGLILETVPVAELEAHAAVLTERMARLPANQLVMMKRVRNQTVENMGFASSRMLGMPFDRIARHSHEFLDFVRRAQEADFRQAVRERDDRFGDSGGPPEALTVVFPRVAGSGDGAPAADW